MQKFVYISTKVFYSNAVLHLRTTSGVSSLYRQYSGHPDGRCVLSTDGANGAIVFFYMIVHVLIW